jgi:hypothetical protein
MRSEDEVILDSVVEDIQQKVIHNEKINKHNMLAVYFMTVNAPSIYGNQYELSIHVTENT